jgi:bacillithiol biosynthesis cysteine-adding enzyme BshC
MPMESACFRHTELPGATRLFTDLLYDFGRVARFYAHDPSDPGSFRKAALDIDLPDERRAALIRVLRAQNGPSASLDLLGRSGAVAILTGQQVGLFTGPCYTIYKALTAVSLARRLRDAGMDAVPVFWLATEDHDFEEVNHCWVFGSDHEPIRLDAAGVDSRGGPAGAVPIGDPPLADLRRTLDGLPFSDEVVASVAEAYSDGETFGASFAKLLKRILGCDDLLFFDPLGPGARELAAPLLAKAVAAGPSLTEALLARGAELEQAGYHAQVRVEAGSSLVFLLENGRRIALRREGDDYVGDGRRFSAQELTGRAQSLSPNALLRPVVEDYMFPTAAYVGGPAELAYFAQSQVLYRELLGRMPVAVPRASATLLDSRTARLLARNGLGLPDLLRGEDAFRERLSAKLAPPEIAASVAGTRLRVAELVDRIGSGVAGLDPGLASWLAKSRRKIDYQLSRIEGKAGREILRRNERADAAARHASRLVFPHGHTQERFYSMLPFLAQYGPSLIARLKDDLSSPGLQHQVLAL